jgi:AcrR family transcriptional regulator
MSIDAPPAPPIRRTQAERSAATRARILDAAVECLVERGYAKTTVEEVARRAGVSLGAERHHFPSKIALLTHAVRHLFAGLRDDARSAFLSLTPGPGRAGAAVELFWESFQDPRSYAALELYFASRTDSALREAFTPVASGHGNDLKTALSLLFPEAASRNPSFGVTWDVIVDVLQGMAIGTVLFGERAAPTEQIAYLKELAEQACAVGGRGDPRNPREDS